jgi:hypothetical protein
MEEVVVAVVAMLLPGLASLHLHPQRPQQSISMKTLVLSIIITLVLGINLSRAATFPTAYNTNTDAVAQAFVHSQIGGQVGPSGSNYQTAAQVIAQVGTQVGPSGSNFLNATSAGTQIGGSNYQTAAQVIIQVGAQTGPSGSNFLNSASAGTQIGGSNYLTAATAGSQIGGSNYTTRAQITASNFLMQAPVTNWFVLTNGSDANTGTASNSATAFRTLQKALTVVASYWYTNITPVSIQMGQGVFNENDVLLPYAGNAIITINGDSSTTTTIAPAAGDAVSASGPVEGYVLQNIRIWPTNGNSVVSSLGASVTIGTGVNFAAAKAGGYHMIANNNGAIIVSGSYSVSGGTGNHLYATRGSVINDTVSPTVTITGTPAFTAFAACDDAGVVAMFNCTFSGSATGKRFDISLNGVMHTLSGSATYFPGNAAGTTNSGAQYQ